MITPEEIEALANLARLDLNEEEKLKLSVDLDQILNYVDQLKEVKGSVTSSETQRAETRNVIRADLLLPPESESSIELVKMAPKHDGKFIRVKKIL